MKKSTHGIRNAMLFEHLRTFFNGQPPVAPRPDGATYMPGNRLYAIDGIPGVWRRVRREVTGLKPGRPGSVLAHFDGTVVELVRDPLIDAELLAAGLQLPMPPASALDGPPSEPDEEPQAEPEPDDAPDDVPDDEPDDEPDEGQDQEAGPTVDPHNGVAGSHGTRPATPSAPTHSKSAPISLPSSTRPSPDPRKGKKPSEPTGKS